MLFLNRETCQKLLNRGLKTVDPKGLWQANEFVWNNENLLCFYGASNPKYGPYIPAFSIAHFLESNQQALQNCKSLFGYELETVNGQLEESWVAKRHHMVSNDWHEIIMKALEDE